MALKKSIWMIVHFEGEVLLLKRGPKANNPGLWNFPGGGVEEGESPKATAVRELFEEAGIKISQNRLELIKTITAKGRVMAYYMVDLKNKVKPTVDGKEISKFKWVPITEYPDDDKLHFQTRTFVQAARKETGI